MFSSLTSYFWGSSEETPVQNETATGTTTCAVVPERDMSSTTPNAHSTTKVRATEQEEDWVLIDKTNCAGGLSSSPSPQRRALMVESDPSMDIVEPPSQGSLHQPDFSSHSLGNISSPSAASLSSPPRDGSSSLSDSCSDVSTTAGTEESWLVTPPPCFTAGGHSLPRLEDNALENLLIEHPSMSVYGPRGRQNSTGVDSENSSVSDETETPNGTASQVGVSIRNPPRRPRGPASARSTALALVRSEKATQRARALKDSRKMSRNYLQRNNRVSHYNTRSNKMVTRKHNHIIQPANVSGKRC